MLKYDLKIDLKIQKVFNYVNIEQSKNTFEEQLWYLLNEPRFDGQVEIVKEIEWLFFTSSDDYVMVGVRGDEVWAMDGDGELTQAEFSLEQFPFYFWSSPIKKVNFWRENSDFCINFLYYFNYCEQNNIKLLPEHLLWKEEIQDLLDNHP
jgi:hypothetical protein